MGHFLPELFIGAILGAICAVLAQGRGRSGGVWFLIGFFAPVLGLILVLVLPDQKEARLKHNTIREEQMRQRELARKDRQIADRRHAALDGRLAAHDRALGIDTQERTYLDDVAQDAPQPPPLGSGSDGAALAASWFYAEEGAPVGPVRVETLRALWEDGRLRPDSLVWCAGMEDWRPLEGLPELQEALVG